MSLLESHHLLATFSCLFSFLSEITALYAVFLPRKSHGQSSLAGHSPLGHKRVRHNLASNQKQGVCLLASSVASVMSDSLTPHGLQPTRLLCPWDSPGKINRVGCHDLLQGIVLTQGLNPLLLCLLHCRHILYSLSHHWKLQGSNYLLGSPHSQGTLILLAPGLPSSSNVWVKPTSVTPSP